MKERLDRFLTADLDKIKLEKTLVYHLNLQQSDHRPMLLDIRFEDSQARKSLIPKPYKFEESWTKFDECSIILKESWNDGLKASAQNISSKVQKCIKQLSIWNKNRLKGSLKGAIDRIEKEIQVLQNSSSNFRSEESLAKEKELDNLLEEEEIYWKIRLREEWLK